MFNHRNESLSSSRLRNSNWLRETEANHFKAAQWLSNVEDRGGTELGLPPQEALQTFKGRIEKTFRSRLVVSVTDGQITGKIPLLDFLAPSPM